MLVCLSSSPLGSFSSLQGSRGELLLSLCYNPSANSIVVNIIKARNLKAMDIGGTSGIWLQNCSFLHTRRYCLTLISKGNHKLLFSWNFGHMPISCEMPGVIKGCFGCLDVWVL